jgi:hypothetical protein
MQIQIIYNRTRRDYLLHLWDEEKDNYATLLKKSKKAEDIELYKNIDNYDKNLVLTLLRLYIDQCKSRHSLAFFQYRNSSFIPYRTSTVITKLIEIFHERVEYMGKVADVV